MNTKGKKAPAGVKAAPAKNAKAQGFTDSTNAKAQRFADMVNAMNAGRVAKSEKATAGKKADKSKAAKTIKAADLVKGAKPGGKKDVLMIAIELPGCGRKKQ